MASSSVRFGSLTFSGDVSTTAPFNAATNPNSPAQEDPVALTAGDNTLAVPAGATGVVVTFPTGNNVLVKLKGAGGDSGISLHKTDPLSMGIDSTQTTVILNAAAPVTVRVYWT